MTSAEMIQAFEVGYDIVNLDGPGYEEDEIFVLLNQSQIIEVLKEIEIKRRTYISNLIVNESGTVAAGLSYNYTKIYTPSEEYIGYISSKSRISRVNFKPIVIAEWVENIDIDKSVSGKYLTNTNNRPILLQPHIYEDSERTITIIYDVNTTFYDGVNFFLEYVKKPVLITDAVNCEINEILHERIVNTAVNLAKKVFNPNESGASVQTDMLINKIL